MGWWTDTVYRHYIKEGHQSWQAAVGFDRKVLAMGTLPYVTDRKSVSSSYGALRPVDKHINSLSRATVSLPEINGWFCVEDIHGLDKIKYRPHNITKTQYNKLWLKNLYWHELSQIEHYEPHKYTVFTVVVLYCITLYSLVFPLLCWFYHIYWFVKVVDFVVLLFTDSQRQLGMQQSNFLSLYTNCLA